MLLRPVLVVVAILVLAITAVAQTENKPRFEQIDIWRDNFGRNCKQEKKCINGIDMNSWSFAAGDGSDDGIDVTRAGVWGNNEAQCYIQNERVVRVVGHPDDAGDGVLLIAALQDKTNEFGCVNAKDGSVATLGYKSARLQTRGKRKFSPPAAGQGSIFIESKIRLPPGGDGIWAAFWMLAEPDNLPNSNLKKFQCGTGGLCNNTYGVWPRSGEIDIMEAVNNMNSTLHSLHYADSAGEQQTLETKSTLSKTRGWHTYGVEWNANYIRHYRDDVYISKFTPAQWRSAFYKNNAANAPFDREFYIILNLAVGGRLPGEVSPSTNFGDDQKMLVDYVRVYRETSKPRPPTKDALFNGGQITLVVLGSLAVIILFLVLSVSAWRNVVTLTRAKSFSDLRKDKPPMERPVADMQPRASPYVQPSPLTQGRPQRGALQVERPYS